MASPPILTGLPRRALLLVLAALCCVVLACRQEVVEEEAQLWLCPMHPTYTSDRAGDCPICGMKLVLDATADAPSASIPANEPAGVPGLAPIHVPQAAGQLAGVETVLVTRGNLARTSRTVGTIVADERRVHHVHTRIAGWVEKLYVATTGELVRKGQPILSIYSPELLAAQEEFVRVRQAAARFEASTVPEVRSGALDLVAAARRRLELLDVPASTINTLERTGQVQRAVTLHAPAGGYLSSKNVVDGMAVEPGLELFTLTDLSQVWVEAQFYENEAPLLHLGQTASVQAPFAQPQPASPQGASPQGTQLPATPATISFVAPAVAPESRTVTVRLELANPTGQWRPGAFVDVVVDFGSREGLLLPTDAVLDTGTRQLVFLETSPGHFAPRVVEILQRSPDQVEVAGVVEGERVVAKANFLIDAESRLRSAIGAATTAPPGARDQTMPEQSTTPDHQH